MWPRWSTRTSFCSILGVTKLKRERERDACNDWAVLHRDLNSAKTFEFVREGEGKGERVLPEERMLKGTEAGCKVWCLHNRLLSFDSLMWKVGRQQGTSSVVFCVHHCS